MIVPTVYTFYGLGTGLSNIPAAANTDLNKNKTHYHHTTFAPLHTTTPLCYYPFKLPPNTTVHVQNCCQNCTKKATSNVLSIWLLLLYRLKRKIYQKLQLAMVDKIMKSSQVRLLDSFLGWILWDFKEKAKILKTNEPLLFHSSKVLFIKKRNKPILKMVHGIYLLTHALIAKYLCIVCS